MKRRWLAMMLAITMAASLIPTGGGLGYVAEAAELQTAVPEEAEMVQVESVEDEPAEDSDDVSRKSGENAVEESEENTSEEPVAEEVTSEEADAGEGEAATAAPAEEKATTAAPAAEESTDAEEETTEELSPATEIVAWQDLGFDLSSENVYLNCGEHGTLMMDETDEVEVTYTWYREVLNTSDMVMEWEVVPDANSSTLEVTGLLMVGTYECVVEAPNMEAGSKMFWVENDLCYGWRSNRSKVREGWSVHLEPFDELMWPLEDYSYQWYRKVECGTNDWGYPVYQWEVVPGANEYWYEFTAAEDNAGCYSVLISDGDEIYGWNWDGQTVELTNEIFWEDLNIDLSDEYTELDCGEHGTLTVDETDEAEVTYTWYRWMPEPEDIACYDWQVLPGETGSTLEITGYLDNSEYKCVLESEGLEPAEKEFRVSSGSTYCWIYSTGEVTVGDPASLQVAISDDYDRLGTEDFTYQWYRETVYGEDEWGYTLYRREAIPGADEYIYEFTADLNSAGDYIVLLFQDGVYSGRAQVCVEVNTFHVTGITQLKVKEGETGTFRIFVAEDNGESQFTYEWQKWDEDEGEYRTIAGATASSYTPPVSSLVNGENEYCCIISDGPSGMAIDCTMEVVPANLGSMYLEYDMRVIPGKSTEVRAILSEGIQVEECRWYLKGVWQEGETDLVFSVPADFTAEVGAYAEFRVECWVVDVNGNEYRYTAWIETTSSLHLSYDSSVYVNYGEDAVLSVKAQSLAGRELEYEWYCLQDNEYEERTCLTNEAECRVSWEDIRNGRLEYRFVVRDGSYERGAMITIYPKLAVEREKYSFESEGAQLTLRADTCTGSEPTTYQWSAYTGSEWDGHYEDIEGATEATLPITVHYQGGGMHQIYRCRITCEGMVDYVVYEIATEGTLVVISGERRWDSDEEGLLSVAAYTSTGNPIIYQWLRLRGDEEPIDGADQPVLHLTEEEMSHWSGNYQQYICRISDGVNTVDYTTYAYRESTLEIYDRYRYVNIHPEDAVTLSVADVTSVKGTITYQWKAWNAYEWEYQPIAGATGAALTVGREYFSTGEEEYRFRCDLSVGSCTDEVFFYVYVKDFWAIAVDEYVTAERGEPVDLKVNASSAGGRPLHYVWYRVEEDYYSDSSDRKQEIPGANSAICPVDTSTLPEHSLFECYVTDGIHEDRASFRVEIPENATIRNTNGGYQYLIPGKSWRMVSKAVSEPGCGALRYQWYRLKGEERIRIPGATGAAYTAPAADLSAGENEYVCQISNDIDTVDSFFSAEVITSAQELTAGEDCWKVLNQAEPWATFTPSTDGIYEFLSDSRWNSFWVYEWDDSREELTELEDCTDDMDYSTSVDGLLVRERLELKAGRTYYIYCNADRDSACVLVREAQVEVRALQTVYGWPNENVTLSVPADCRRDGYTYQWYILYSEGYEDNYTFYPITGADGPAFMVKSIVDENSDKRLCCVVNTGSREIRLTYLLKLNSVRAEGDILEYRSEKALGSAIDITAAATSMYEDATITYKWFEGYGYSDYIGDYDSIPGANSARYQGRMPAELIYVDRDEHGYRYDEYMLICQISDGYSTVWVSYIFEPEEGEPEPHVHSWSSYTVTGEADCTTAGAKVRTCYCGETETVTIPALGHDFVNGKTKHQCSRCDKWELSTPILGTLTNPTNALQLTWQAVDGAAKYRVYRKTATTGWAKLADTTATSCKDTTGVTGTTYIYTVRAFASDGLLGSNFDTTGLSCTYQCTPVLSKVENVVGGVKVTWQAATGAPKYRVFRKAAGETSWTRVGDTASTAITDTAAVSGTTYYYTVRVLSADAKSYLSTFNSTGLSVLCLKDLKPTLTNAATGITVKWSQVTGAKGYYVYRKSGTGSYARIATITDGSTVAYTDTAVNAKSGTTYTYAVRAYNGTTAGAYTGASILRLANIKPTLANASTGITVKWTKVAGAAGYYVYRKTGSSNYARIATITEGSTVSYTDTTSTLVNGTAYTYAVKAYNGSTTGSFTGVATYRLKGVTISSLTNAATLSMIVKWAADTKVTGYQVQYSTTSDFSSGNKTVTIAKNSTVSTTIKSLTKGKTYYVRMRAYKQNSSGTNYFSGWSAKKYVKIAK